MSFAITSKSCRALRCEANDLHSINEGVCAKVLWERLVEEKSFDGAYSSVKRYVRKLRDELSLLLGCVIRAPVARRPNVLDVVLADADADAPIGA